MRMDNKTMVSAVAGLNEIKEQAEQTRNPMQKARLAEAGLNTAIAVIEELVNREVQRGEHG